MLIENRHFAEEFSVAQFRKSCIVPISIFHADAHATGLDEIHRVARIAAIKQRCSARFFTHRKKIAKLERRVVIQIAEKGDRSQRLNFHREKVKAQARHSESLGARQLFKAWEIRRVVKIVSCAALSDSAIDGV